MCRVVAVCIVEHMTRFDLEVHEVCKHIALVQEGIEGQFGCLSIALADLAPARLSSRFTKLLQFINVGEMEREGGRGGAHNVFVREISICRCHDLCSF